MTLHSFTTASTETKAVEMPASTAWPIILAFGLTLVFAGLVTSLSVSLLGVILAVTGSIGWFREVLPHERHESVSIVEKAAPISTSRPQVAVVEWMTQELPRARLPLEIYPVSAGLSGDVVRDYQPTGNMVRHQCPGRRILSQPTRPGADWGVSMGFLARCERRSLTAVLTRWTSLWCDAADVSSPPDFAWRRDGAHRVVRFSP